MPARRDKRSWEQARAKIDDEGCCRVCLRRPVEAAHVIGRKHDHRTREGGKVVAITVNPDSVVPLCPRDHRDYDAGKLDLMPFLTIKEQVQAVIEAGGIEPARRRIIGSEQYRSV